MKAKKIGKNTLKVVLLSITVLIAVAMLMSAWGGLVNPTKSRVLPLATLAMPLILIVNLVVALLWLCVLRWKYALIPLAAIIISWSPVSTVCPLNFFSRGNANDSTFKVLTFNVANFDYVNQQNPSESMRYILDQNADFVLMQEGSQDRNYMTVPNVITMRDELVQKYPYHSDGNRDLVMLSKYPYTVVRDSVYVNTPDYYGCVCAKTFDIELPSGKQLRILNLHLRTIGMDRDDKNLYDSITKLDVDVKKRSDLRRIKRSLFDKLKRAYELHAEEAVIVRSIIDKSPPNVIVCGDFNDTPSSYCYRTIRGDDLRDSFQDCGLGLTYTFYAKRLFFKIDHILYRGSLEAVDWYRDKVGDSDHYPQVATFVWK